MKSAFLRGITFICPYNHQEHPNNLTIPLFGWLEPILDGLYFFKRPLEGDSIRVGEGSSRENTLLGLSL